MAMTMLHGGQLAVCLSCLLLLSGWTVRQAACLPASGDRYRVPELQRINHVEARDADRYRVPERTLSDRDNSVHRISNVSFFRQFNK